MINQQLLTYISNQQETGIDDQVIKENLLSAGWREEDVDEGFQAVENNLVEENSTKVHQQIRKEAAQDKVNKRNQTADTESNSSDSYRESIENVDTAENENTSESGNNESNSDIDSDETKQEGTLDTETSTDEDSGDASPKKLESIGDESNPLDSNEEMKKMASSTTSSDIDPEASEPMAIRTYYGDSEKAGGNISAADISSQEKMKKSSVNNNENISLVKKQKIKKESLNDTTKNTATQNEVREISSKNKIQNSRNQMESVRDDVSDNKSQNRGMSNPNKRRFSTEKNVNTKVSKKRIATEDKHSGSKFISAVIFLLVLVLVGGGGAYAYLNFYQTSAPEVTSDQMMRSLSNARSFEFRIIVDSAETEDEVASRLEIEGAIDLDPNNQAESYYVITSSDENESPIQVTMAETGIIQSVPDAQQETIKDILLTPDFITLGEFQTKERLGQTSENEGINTNRFGVTLDPSQLISDYATFHQALLGDPLSEEALNSVQSTIGAFTPTQGQAWLDTETNTPYQITLIGSGAENQDMQINIQIRNHGETAETTPSYEPQSIEGAIVKLFSDTKAEEDLQIDQTVMRQIDQLRINNIQQISVALRMFVNENGFFPDSLDQLISNENAVLSTIPGDPVSGNNDIYEYSISDTAEQYHLGSTLQFLTRSEVMNDANFNSAEQGYVNGFNGASTSCALSSELQPISTCYDIIGTTQ